jgi:hypothetical protein
MQYFGDHENITLPKLVSKPKSAESESRKWEIQHPFATVLRGVNIIKFLPSNSILKTILQLGPG